MIFREDGLGDRRVLRFLCKISEPRKHVSACTHMCTNTHKISVYNNPHINNSYLAFCQDSKLVQIMILCILENFLRCFSLLLWLAEVSPLHSLS